MHAVLYKTDTKEIVNIINDAIDVTNKVVNAVNITLDFSGEDDTDCVLTNNVFSVGEALPETIVEPLSEIQQLRLDQAQSSAELFEMMLMLTGGGAV